jgi:hypothetical protein
MDPQDGRTSFQSLNLISAYAGSIYTEGRVHVKVGPDLST